MTRPGAGWCVWAAIIISVEIKTSRIRWLASTGPGPGYDHWCWEHWNVRHVTFSGTFYSNESHILIHKISGQNKYLTLNCQWKIITGVLLQLLENIINEWPLRLTGTSRVFSESNSVSDTTFEMCGQLFSNWMTEEKESTDDQLTKLYNELKHRLLIKYCLQTALMKFSFGLIQTFNDLNFEYNWGGKWVNNVSPRLSKSTHERIHQGNIKSCLCWLSCPKLTQHLDRWRVFRW